MLLPLLLSLALQTAPPAEVRKEPASATPAAATKPPAAKAGEDASDIPHGAPTDDYGFTAWCRGALSGHMELYPAVKAELQKVEEEKASKEDARYTTDAERETAVQRRVKEALDDTKLDEAQLAAGRTYLKLYSEAITAAEAASADNLRKRGEESQDAGYRIWAAARGAEPRTKMWSWVMWELPARCETAARRLLDRSSLLAGALKPQVVTQAKAEGVAASETAAPDDGKPADAATSAAPSDSVAVLVPAPSAAATETPPAAGSEASKLPEAPDAKLEAEVGRKEAATSDEAAKAVVDDAPTIRRTRAAPDADGPVARRPSAAPPADAPDSPRPEPKP